MMYSEARAEKITDADRKAYCKAIAERDHKARVQVWLNADPRIGVLNGGRYYRIIGGETVYINELDGAA